MKSKSFITLTLILGLLSGFKITGKACHLQNVYLNADCIKDEGVYYIYYEIAAITDRNEIDVNYNFIVTSSSGIEYPEEGSFTSTKEDNELIWHSGKVGPLECSIYSISGDAENIYNSLSFNLDNIECTYAIDCKNDACDDLFIALEKLEDAYINCKKLGIINRIRARKALEIAEYYITKANIKLTMCNAIDFIDIIDICDENIPTILSDMIYITTNNISKSISLKYASICIKHAQKELTGIIDHDALNAIKYAKKFIEKLTDSICD